MCVCVCVCVCVNSPAVVDVDNPSTQPKLYDATDHCNSAATMLVGPVLSTNSNLTGGRC